MNESTCDLSPAKKVFSRIGLALSAILLIATALQLIWITVPTLIWDNENWMTGSSWGRWIGSFAPLYVVAIPVGLLIMSKLPAQTPQDNKLGMKSFLVYLPICFFLMYSGNIIGTILSLILSGGNAQNTIVDYAMDTNPLKVLVMVILAPLLEEYIFRKQIIDRTRQYGEKYAVFLSALTFGLLHQNLFQFFYAFGLGLVFAYIYTRTGRLRYSVLLHGIINFMGAVVAPLILSVVDLEAMMDIDPNAATEELIALYEQILPGLMVYLLYAMFLFAMFIAGLVLIILKRRQLVWSEAEAQLPKSAAGKTVYLNVGMVLYVLLCITSIIISLF